MQVKQCHMYGGLLGKETKCKNHFPGTKSELWHTEITRGWEIFKKKNQKNTSTYMKAIVCFLL